MSFLDRIIHWDQELFLALNNLGTKTLDPVFLLLSEVYVWIPLYLVFVYLLFKKFDLKTALVYMAGAVVVTILTDQISVHLFKNVFERLRPCHTQELIPLMRLVKEGCGGYYGFVSSHATNTFGFALFMGSVFSAKYKWVKPALLVWALVISYSRIYLGVHFPLDVICGGLLGIVIGKGVFKLIQKNLAPRQPVV